MAEMLRLEKVEKTFSPGTPQEKKALEALSLTLEKGVAADSSLTKLMRALAPGTRGPLCIAGAGKSRYNVPRHMPAAHPAAPIFWQRPAALQHIPFIPNI